MTAQFDGHALVSDLVLCLFYFNLRARVSARIPIQRIRWTSPIHWTPAHAFVPAQPSTPEKRYSMCEKSYKRSRQTEGSVFLRRGLCEPLETKDRKGSTCFNAEGGFLEWPISIRRCKCLVNAGIYFDTMIPAGQVADHFSVGDLWDPLHRHQGFGVAARLARRLGWLLNPLRHRFWARLWFFLVVIRWAWRIAGSETRFDLNLGRFRIFDWLCALS